MNKYFAEILWEIERKSSIKPFWNSEEFYQEIVRGYFISKMGYEKRDSSITEQEDTFQKGTMLIRGSAEEKYERELESLICQMEKRGCNWGILVHPTGIWLMNADLVPNGEKSFKNPQVVLEVIYGMNTDQKYFRYFSAENTIGEKRNAYFFKDIIDYRNNAYKGKEKSWPAYGSALKRFCDFYVEFKGDYGQEENIYDRIRYPFFVEFMRDGTNCKSLTSARNAFFYIKDFMQLKSKKGEFDDPGRISRSFPEFLPKSETQDIMCIDKLKKALGFLESNRSGVRNKTILLFFLAYGMERRKLCALKWANVHLKSKLLMISQKKYPMPEYLIEMLAKLREEGTSGDYVFCNSDGKVLSDGAVNTILSGIAKVDLDDGFYNWLTPANIRRYLARYLLRHGYPLEKILYLMDIDGYKLESYLPKEEIEERFWEKCEEPAISSEAWHPMETFLEQLR